MRYQLRRVLSSSEGRTEDKWNAKEKKNKLKDRNSILMSKGKEVMLLRAGTRSWAGAGTVCLCSGCGTGGGNSAASFPGESRYVGAPAGGKSQSCGTNGQGKQPGGVAHVDRRDRLLQLICLAKGCRESGAANLV